MNKKRKIAMTGWSKKEGMDPKVKDILMLLGAGATLAACAVFPGLPVAFKPILDAKKEAKRKKDLKEWERETCF